ncbi:MAG: cytochrome P450 [Dehalococcoidia bacterium]|nr:MAG: cytochrome P450 [Dehalococcoidia bacterium]
MTVALPPGPRPLAVTLGLAQFRRNPAVALERLARQFGDVVLVALPGQSLVLVNDPELIHRVLVVDHALFTKGRALQTAKRVLGDGLLTSEGDHHRRQRRLIQPAFHRQRIAGYAATMVDLAARWSARWNDGTTIDLADEMMRLTLAVAGKTLFGADVENDADVVGETLRQLMTLFDILTLPFADLFDRLPFGPSRGWRESRRRLDAIIYRLIDERRRSGDGDDLLSMLVAARDEHGAMTDEQVRDEALTIFLAGHETTANALTWTWYLLSQHPTIEAALHDELDRVLGGRLPTFGDLDRLTYTRMVIAESMRLYPPAWAIGRRALDAYQLGDYLVPAGTIVLVSQWVMHRDARYWPDPLRFDPTRFLPEAVASRPRLSYFPFGAGPRICIGESFAWTEATLLLATLAQRWRARLVPGHRVDILPAVTLRPRFGMRMTLSRRTSAVGSGSH